MRAVIAVLPGDGIGPEVVDQARRVLSAVSEKWGHTFTLNDAAIGGIAIDQTGSALPPETLEIARAADAVLLGAVGGPKWDDPARQGPPRAGPAGDSQGARPVREPAPRLRQPQLLHASPLRPELWPAST